MRRFILLIAVVGALPATALAADWPTFHGANSRQGDDTSDPGLANPTAAWTSAQLDGDVIGQPVIVGNQVIVGTENNTVYSLSASSGTVQWSTHLSTPRTTITCGNINPLGITGTPAVDNGSVFVVEDVQNSSTSFTFNLVSLSLASGAVQFTHDLTPTDSQWAADVQWEQQRGALLVTGGRVYVPLGGLDGDCGSYHGYILSFAENGSGSVTWWAASEVNSGDNEAGIWAAGGLSQDASGFIYAGTGNSNHGSSSDPYDYSDGVIKLDPAHLAPGAPADYFAPSTWYTDNAGDVDLGSTTPLQLPNNRVFIVGKSGTGYLLNTASLGHIGGQLAAHQVCTATNNAAFGSLAYDGGVVFVGCSDGLAAVKIAASNNDFTADWYNTTNVSNHPPTVAGGLVWSVSSGGGQLLGFSLSNGQQIRSLSVSGSTHFTTPSAANGRLYVAGNKHVNAFSGAAVATRYHPLPPYRVLDTRASSCVQCTGGALGPGAQRVVGIAGYRPTGFTGTVVPSSAAAVVVNLTATGGTMGTFLTLFPSGASLPNASNVNPPPGRDIANLVTVPVGLSGSVTVYNSMGTIDVVLDVEGYYDASTGSDGTFHPLTPIRMCDSRAGGGTVCATSTDVPLTPGSHRLVTVTGSPPSGGAGIPVNGTAEAGVFNLTAVAGTDATYITAYPPDPSTHQCGLQPNASTLNVPAHTNQPNRVIVPIDPTNGAICLYNSQGTINFVIDVNGWYGNGSEATLGAHFVALTPVRLCDTRAGQGTACQGHTLTQGGTLTVQASGVDGVPPSGVQAVSLNATAVIASAPTYLDLYAANATRPPTSDLNVDQGETIANFTIVALSSTGSLDVNNNAGNVDVVLDASGWFQ